MCGAARYVLEMRIQTPCVLLIGGLLWALTRLYVGLQRKAHVSLVTLFAQNTFCDTVVGLDKSDALSWIHIHENAAAALTSGILEYISCIAIENGHSAVPQISTFPTATFVCLQSKGKNKCYTNRERIHGMEFFCKTY